MEIWGKFFLLKLWTPSMRLDNKDVRIVPVWIQLPGLEVQFWSMKGLSKIASKVGKPLFDEKCTVHKEKISFARVLVEMDLSKIPP